MTPAATGAGRNRGPLLILFALFTLPLALAFVLYYGMGWRPGGGTQHGDLLDPARPLPDVSLMRADGHPTGSGFLRTRWSLVYVGRGSCDPACRQALLDTRQIRLALDRQATRVQRVLLYLGEYGDAAGIRRDHPDLLAARVDSAPGAELLRPFPELDGVPVASAGRIYVVDPLGNLVVSYPPAADRRGLLKDMERLLKLSHIG
jgi:hypothetical protein